MKRTLPVNPAGLAAFVLFALTASASIAPLAAQPELHTTNIRSAAELRAYFRHSPDRDIVIAGHRGGVMKGFPENCIASCEKTLSLMPAYFEIDTRMTKDGVIVLMHDATINRTTTGKGRVCDYTYAELREFFLKDREGNVTKHKIPTLDEMLAWGEGKTVFNIDNKDVPWEVMVANLNGKWKHYRNLMFYVLTLREAQYYARNNPNVGFFYEISDDAMYDEFAASGIPWNRIVAYVRNTMDPKKRALYERIRANGVMCQVALAPTADKGKTIDKRIDAYLKEIARGPDIIETDYPSSFVAMPLNRGKNAGSPKPKHTVHIKSMAELQEYFRYSPEKEIIISGHRGGMMKGYPENCIPSFEKTLSLMPSFFEIDPRMTKDGVLVLMHDGTINRTTTGKGKTENYTYAELQQFYLVDRQKNVTPYKIPTLDEVLEWGADKVVFNFDNKKIPWQVYSDNLKGKWSKYHNIILSVRSLEECLFYYERNDNVMFCCEIGDMKQYEAYRDSGIPWNRIMAYVRYKMDPEHQKVYDLLRSHGVMCMTAIAPTSDKVKPFEARIEAYKKELASNPDIIETDYPADFANLSRKRTKK
ncbi:glycerophosphoryl diester phosphodiesterase [Ereboglobus sp. PH5-5]|uniref:glycerophosphodiester phosphodiesterase family protein n=1 Tax=Ereboglobus sp. PH5-5 TaxID=2940529 RepID=UPI002404DBED|nr:glycerophosphodiester phosphodiesterase family protein [Ereboglobus sp. PH5-5]MDF9832628.1 glycerophosphoryl diester phosphodiesterase [Ereboglobus sp. PH5-5]